MRLLPASLWLLIAARIEAQEQQQQQQQQLPTAIKKMSPDQGEKFLHEYAAFADSDALPQNGYLVGGRSAPEGLPVVRRHGLYEDADSDLLAHNSSAELFFRPPFAPHLESDMVVQTGDEGLRRRWSAQELFRRAASALAHLQGRQWLCPSGTNSCSSIGFPNSCCASGETCVQIEDTGLGSVGCCPSGANCSGSIKNCASGNTPCASEIGGGCCIPGFVCQGVGCKYHL